MPITLDGTTGVTAAAFDGALDAADLTGNVAAARITDALNATGSAPIYATRAWVNFNGTGAVAIRQSANVTSITDNGTGSFNVNLTTALTDANYVVSTTGNGDTGDNHTDSTPTASSFRTIWIDIGAGLRDPSIAQVSVLR